MNGWVGGKRVGGRDGGKSGRRRKGSNLRRGEGKEEKEGRARDFYGAADYHRVGRQSTTPSTRKTGKLFFFLLLLSFFLSFFRRASSASPQSLIMVFARNSSISHRAVHQPIAFRNLPSLHQAAAAAHSITMASFVTPFSCLYACALKRSLSNDT